MKKKDILEITSFIHVIRDQKVMLDRDLAELYGVEARAVNQAIKRNEARFPSDFQFRLTKTEFIYLQSQNVIVTKHNLSPRSDQLPRVFTEQGAFSLSFVLKSEKAIEMGIFIARAFTHLRRFILKNENIMMELKNNDHLSKTFSNFEKRIEQDLIVLYKNSSKFERRVKAVEADMFELRKLLRKLSEISS